MKEHLEKFTGTKNCARIIDVSFYLPETILCNETLAAIYSEWPADKIFNKTGIKKSTLPHLKRPRGIWRFKRRRIYFARRVCKVGPRFEAVPSWWFKLSFLKG